MDVAVIAQWYGGLFKIGTVTDVRSVVFRVALVVAAPLVIAEFISRPAAGFLSAATALFVTLSDVGQSRAARLIAMLAGWVAICLGGVAGHLLRHTPGGGEILVLLCAVVAGWTSGSHPSVAGATRLLAIAAAVATELPFRDPDLLFGLGTGAISAFGSAVLTWSYFGTPVTDNVIDWRAGVRRAFFGDEPNIRFALCYGAAAAIALFASSSLGVQHAVWATLVVLSVMRPEGTASLRLTIHYALGTVLGVILANLIRPFVDGTPILVLLATLVAVFFRIGFAINPALGYTALTMFVLLGVRIVTGIPPDLLETRVYDVAVGCTLAVLGTLAATYPRHPIGWFSRGTQ